MRLYLVQHGDAVSKEVDPSRPLSEKGVSDIRNLANFLKGEFSVPLLLHSGKARAQQSAAILAEALQQRITIEPFSGLSPNDPLETLISWLQGRSEDTLIVGHLPYLSRLVTRLVTKSANHAIVDFTPGTIVCIDIKPAFSGQILWMIQPDLLREG